MDEDEEVPVVHASVQIHSPSPQKQKCSVKGKEKAVEGDVDMSVDDRESKGRDSGKFRVCVVFFSSSFVLFFILSFTMDAQALMPHF